MNFDEFDNYQFGAGIAAKYKGKEYTVISVDFNERLFGLLLDCCHDDDDLMWVRCENVTIEKQQPPHTKNLNGVYVNDLSEEK